MDLKKRWKKIGACIALSSAMVFSSVGGALPVNLVETAYAEEVGAAHKITANILTDFNTGFEGAENGKLYWWNDGKWSQEYISQEAHSEDTTFENSGGHYIKVSPVTGESSVCQICSDNIAKAFQKGATYEFSYYVKKIDGPENGNVSLGITSASTDWSTTKEAVINKDVESLSNEWTRVTGTFVMEETYDQVKVSFIGSEGLTFGVDDLQIGLLESGNSGITYGDNIIQNGDFANEDAVNSWKGAVGDSTISVVSGNDVVIGNSEFKSYGVIERDPSNAKPWNCFSQDISEAVEIGAEYEFSFWAKLSEDYEDAPEEKRKVEFAPYYKAGEAQDYNTSGALSGECSKVLTVGEWTKFTGTFKIPKKAANGETIDGVVIRIIEQGTNYGSGECVLGDYCVAGVSMKKISKPKPEIEQNIPNWKDTITAADALGSDGIAGAGINIDEIKDDTAVELVKKHFNAVTFGNELKPDALFNYQIGRSVSTKTIEFKGQKLEVPVVNDKNESLDFSRADEMVEKVMAWNTANPDKKIRIRGHVLVWHSQTPEWFFCKNYDMSKGYVDKDTMNLRLEWFISSVFDHYFGAAANHKYDGLFYGWDVVNEAVIENRYRHGNEIDDAKDTSESDTRHGANSCWWRVYNSNEFIINAFKYANQYAPKDVELYYNDFGETNNTKCEGIVQLIKDVKAAIGTRLDAFGMQAHYDVDGFSAAQFKNVAEKYIEAAGKVQLTELDFKASSTYDGSAAAKESEYTKMAYCHKNLFEAIKSLNKNGSKVSGLTVWGVIEPNSWLHTASNVGGGANGSKQCPLLFDGNYKAKPAYWAYVNASKLEPAIQKITITEAKNGKISGETYNIEQDEVQASFIPVWDKDGLTVSVNVKDATVDTNDSVTVYVDPSNSASDVTPVKKTVTRAEANASADGYQATVKIPMEGLKVAQKIGMDVVVTNNGQVGSFNDLKGMQETSSKYYAVATVKPGVEKITYGTITVDGEEDAAWKNAVTIPLTINLGSEVSADAKALWDNNNLYVYAVIKDSVLDKTGGQKHEQDSLEVFIDEDNGKTVSYGEDDKQYRINYENEQSFNGKKCNAENVSSKTKKIDGGYVVEAAFKWTDITPENGTKIGLEFQVNDAKNGKRTGTLSWYDETGLGWSGSNVYGTVELVNKTSGNGGSSGSGSSGVQPETKPDSGNGTKPDSGNETKPDSGNETKPDTPQQPDTPEPPKKGDVVADDKTYVKVEVSDVKKKEVKYKEPANKKAKTVSIPATVKINGVTYKVTKIADNAFKNNKTITKVTVGSNIKTIGKNAFSGATKLKTVSVGKNVTEVGANAFKGCSSLTSVTLGSKATKIGANAFNGCKKLKTIKITSTKLSSKTVAKNAFKGLTKATTIKVPKKKFSAYKKLFKQKGLSSKVKVKGY